MAITYTWQLTGLKKKNIDALNNYVVTVYWKKNGTDENGIVGEFISATPFAPEVSASTFTNYNDLTESQVLGWVQGVVTGSYETHVNAQIQKQIDDKKNAETEVASGSFPWSK